MAAAHWTPLNIPDLTDKVMIVTGANSGVGYESAKALAAKGARVVLAVRSREKGRAALEAIRREHPQASVEVSVLDLADLESICCFVDDFHRRFSRLDVLVNNAGVMIIPYRKTVDGFERQFGTNHLGHFALTGLLLPSLRVTPGARVVTVSSINHNFGRIRFDNLNAEKSYQRWGAYAQSKLANLLFAYELQRRFERSGVAALSVACHPGVCGTNLLMVGARMEGSWLRQAGWRFVLLFFQSARMGALPVLYAAVAPEVKGGDYIGPLGLAGIGGYPGQVRSNARAYNTEVAKKLWNVSTQLTGVHYRLAE